MHEVLITEDEDLSLIFEIHIVKEESVPSICPVIATCTLYYAWICARMYTHSNTQTNKCIKMYIMDLLECFAAFQKQYF